MNFKNSVTILVLLLILITVYSSCNKADKGSIADETTSNVSIVDTPEQQPIKTNSSDTEIEPPEKVLADAKQTDQEPMLTPDPLSAHDYVFSPWDVGDRREGWAWAYIDANDAWGMSGNDGSGWSGLSSDEISNISRRIESGLMKSYLLPNHTLVQVLSESTNGHPTVIKIEVLKGQQIISEEEWNKDDGDYIDADGKVLYIFTDDVVRKGTYASLEERKAAEASEVDTVAAYGGGGNVPRFYRK